MTDEKASDIIRDMLKLRENTELITIKEAAEIYGCSPTRLHQFVRANRLIPLISEGRITIFDKADVERLRDENLPMRRKFEQSVIEAARKRGDIKRAARAAA